VVNLRWDGDVLGSMTAGFVRPADDGASWTVTFLGTEGILELSPTEMDAGSLRLLRGTEERRMDFAGAPDAFQAQAAAFLASLRGAGACRNRPEDALGDLRVAAAAARSARTLRTVTHLAGSTTTSPSR
jgi:predicted dehydrogenase